MKWIDRQEIERKRRLVWHRWFAWHPVKVGSCNFDGIETPPSIVWLEYVERVWINRYIPDLFASLDKTRSVTTTTAWRWVYRPDRSAHK